MLGCATSDTLKGGGSCRREVALDSERSDSCTCCYLYLWPGCGCVPCSVPHFTVHKDTERISPDPPERFLLTYSTPQTGLSLLQPGFKGTMQL
ncbi:hypothetical protein PBY51_025055 [Eleginops maclovinus]|uniref:Uncharacterized protein n=1 Tax=Eleginops maclovinus TaxID=56733 RepID=A0AAN7Y0P6_ELEMC|nr:hypothetical protein PBY51_025055 [Eleginops maclovinus]